jgi:hypothetical protein
MRARCIPFVLSVAALLTPAGEAWSRTIFDGAWSVMIITERGEACDRAYAYPIRIDNGAVRYAGDFSIQLAGRVAPNGTVRVTVASAGRQAHGVGRMSRNFGSGTWSGRSATGQCSGRWHAERR